MKRTVSLFGLPGLALSGLAVAALAGFGVLSRDPGPPPFDAPATVTVPAGTVDWRPLGNFSYEGKARTPRPIATDVAGFEIMQQQVTRAQYAACIEDGACTPVPTSAASGKDLPQTHVNWYDATAFASWYAKRTGLPWRLPTDVEWQLAAGARYGDAAAPPEARDPGQRMLESYRSGVFLRGSASLPVRPAGAFGKNARGIEDMGGNIWEWTDGCMKNGRIAQSGRVTLTSDYCGVRIAGGRHRAAIIDFVRDASVGGCAVGLPPDHLGFRLVRGEG
ncbi:formylglycine-generating enzyme family protein [Mesobaculum littorinae]|uniref:Formylglycine-generating enzyme family protein n=1 Tax=Mesobaculum littorinae TaxID=2486419 RepID=A0A438ADF9_9RHOB|nr:SUMF1/EgtB/PvdO family nonheme iron enzyme [Mesobaculum littorinae]RVV96719.1 formylglycine-generating enzyme family protein [Mesobaculum littorinae]